MSDELPAGTVPASNAERRMEVILQELAGTLTATQAATLLGVSRKVYYEWRDRAFQGLRTALEDRSPGRPKKAMDPEAEALRKKVAQLEADLKMQKLTLLVHKEFASLRPGAAVVAKPVKGESKTRAKKKRHDGS